MRSLLCFALVLLGSSLVQSATLADMLAEVAEIRELEDVIVNMTSIVKRVLPSVVTLSKDTAETPYYVQGHLCEIRAALQAAKDESEELTGMVTAEGLQDLRDFIAQQIANGDAIADLSRDIDSHHASEDPTMMKDLLAIKDGVIKLKTDWEDKIRAITEGIRERVETLCNFMTQGNEILTNKTRNIEAIVEGASGSLANMRTKADNAMAMLEKMKDVSNLMEFEAATETQEVIEREAGILVTRTQEAHASCGDYLGLTKDAAQALRESITEPDCTTPLLPEL